MIYEYRCWNTEKKGCKAVDVQKSVADRDNPVYCQNCSQMMFRAISVPQLITQPFHLRDENRPPEMSSLDRLARQKADDKVYEASYKAAAPDSGQSLVDMASKMGVL